MHTKTKYKTTDKHYETDLGRSTQLCYCAKFIFFIDGNCSHPSQSIIYLSNTHIVVNIAKFRFVLFKNTIYSELIDLPEKLYNGFL